MRRALFLAALLITLSGRTHAVDGVGLSEFFPALNWLVWGPLVFAAFYVLCRGFELGSPKKPSTLRMLCSAVVAGLLLLPMAYPVVKSSYAKHLCGKEAAVVVITPPEQWNPKQQLQPEAPTRNAGPTHETRRQVSVGISEYWATSKRRVGVDEYRIRLVDEMSRATLMSSLSFSSDGFHRPHGCGGNEHYWKQRELYVKKAREQVQAP